MSANGLMRGFEDDICRRVILQIYRSAPKGFADAKAIQGQYVFKGNMKSREKMGRQN